MLSLRNTRHWLLLSFLVTIIAVLSFLQEESVQADTKPTIVVGSKPFTENYILAEMAAQLLEETGEVEVVRKFGIGGTGMVNAALQAKEIDIYPEYTGTIARAILKRPELNTYSALATELRSQGLVISKPFGFNNTYAIAVRKETAAKRNLKSISDLKGHSDLIPGFHHEFINRKDGWIGLKEFYDIRFDKVDGVNHSLAYEAMNNKKIDIINAYSTDAKISRFDLVVLEDDRSFFPVYHGLFLVRSEFVDRYPKLWQKLKSLEGKLDDGLMAALNAKVEIDKESFRQVAAGFLGKEQRSSSFWSLAKQVQYAKEHSYLVFISLLIATVLAVPLGVIATRNRIVAQVVLLVSGLLQTIPSLALLCLLIPFFGIGIMPALVALFLYALLPIVRNTYTGINSIDPGLIESARALGLKPMKRLFLIELPLASPSIMAGVKTSAIINVGTATLAALIGAGGFGVPIITGLAINETEMILSGAIPAALFAILLHGVFEVVDRIVIPKGIRV